MCMFVPYFTPFMVLMSYFKKGVFKQWWFKVTNEPTISEDYDSLTFEAPYAGAGALMGIKGDSALSSFTPSELTESSAIHGDFDQASLNYSGHQNLEVRAESFAADECNECGTVMAISPCCETSYCPTQDFDCDCEKHYFHAMFTISLPQTLW